jgi:Flp pilus assembly protein TadG
MSQVATSTSQLQSQRGAVAVEFALIVPLFLLLLLGMFDFGKAFNYWIDGTHLSHEGVRFAAVGKNPGPGATLAESIKQRADTDELVNGGDSVSGTRVCVRFPDGTSRVGDPVEVEVEFTYKFLPYITSIASDLTSTTVTNTSTMRLEQDPPFPNHCTA